MQFPRLNIIALDLMFDYDCMICMRFTDIE